VYTQMYALVGQRPPPPTTRKCICSTGAAQGYQGWHPHSCMHASPSLQHAHTHTKSCPRRDCTLHAPLLQHTHTCHTRLRRPSLKSPLNTHPWRAATNRRCHDPPAQLQQLPEHTFHPYFLQHLQQLTNTFAHPDNTEPCKDMVKQLLSVGMIPTLQARLLVLDSCFIFYPLAGGPVSPEDPRPAVCAPGSALRVPVATADEVDSFCAIMAALLNLLHATLLLVPLGQQTAEGGDDLVLGALGQLLADAASLKAIVRRGLSGEVQEVAKRGSRAAMDCMDAVSCLFRLVALNLWMHVAPGTGGTTLAGELGGQLVAFLHREENLPVLELLCLPPGRSEPHTAPYNDKLPSCLLTCMSYLDVGAHYHALGSSVIEQQEGPTHLQESGPQDAANVASDVATRNS
jgi:hypothetical protein